MVILKQVMVFREIIDHFPLKHLTLTTKLKKCYESNFDFFCYLIINKYNFFFIIIYSIFFHFIFLLFINISLFSLHLIYFQIRKFELKTKNFNIIYDTI